MNKYSILYGISGLLLFYSCNDKSSLGNLTCEYRHDPFAIETGSPSLSWMLKGNGFNLHQTSYQILVADSREKLNADNSNIWNSGIVKSDKSIQITYGGIPLKADKTYYWKVGVTTNRNKHTKWSQTAFWRQVETNPKKQWIGYHVATDKPDCISSIWYRYTFTIKGHIEGPVYADVGTPGFYELYINGCRVGNDMMSPSVSGKDKRTFYVTYDITKYLKTGKNVIGAWIGKGWFGPGAIPFHFSSRIPIVDSDDLQILCSNDWKASKSCYETLGTWDWNQFGGECLNANKMDVRWNTIDFDDSGWDHAHIVNAPSPFIEAQPCELNRHSEKHTAKITPIGNKWYELDFGTNMTGYASMLLPNLQKDDTVRIYYADRRWHSLHADSTPAGIVRSGGGDKVFGLGKDSVRYQTHNQMDMFISSGKKKERFMSKFNCHGFRYAIIEGCKSKPEDVAAYCLETNLKRIGYFTCSDTLLNRMHQVDDRTMRSLNQGAVYVDCPTRERLGYGDGQVSVESSIMNYYMPNFYRKFAKDWILRQDTTMGKLPNVAPNYQGGGGLGWGGIVASIVWRNYLYNGDEELLNFGYQPMMRYLNYIESKCVNNIYMGEKDRWQSIGDWLAPGRGMDSNNWPKDEWNNFFNNCYRVILWRIQLAAAKTLDKREDIAMCQKKIDDIIPQINKRYFDEKNGIYVSYEQTYLLMPLVAEIVPMQYKNQMQIKLIEKIRSQKSVGTGMFGTYFLINYLQEKNQNELLYQITNHTKYPGWGYMLSQGATTWWEQWNGFWSNIHSCFTSLDSWFYEGLAGIRPNFKSPGMKEFIINPSFVPSLSFVKAQTESMYGIIKSEWTRQGNNIILKVEIPSNTKSTVIIPPSYHLISINHVKDTKNMIKENRVDLPSGQYKIKCQEIR